MSPMCTLAYYLQGKLYLAARHVPKHVPDVHRIVLFTMQSAPRRQRRQGQKNEDAPRQNAKYFSPPDVPKRVPGVHRIIFFTRQSAPRRSEEKCGRDLGGSAICPTNVAAAKARAPVCPTIGGDVHRTILFTRQSVPRRSEGKCGRRLGESGVRAKKVRTLHAKSPLGNSPADPPDPADTSVARII